MKILVTGATGFIGSHFTKMALTEGHVVVAFYRASNKQHLERLRDCIDDRRLKLVQGDLLGDISGICEGADWVVNFAARTFVDHSLKDPLPFIRSNVVGAHKLLEDARRYKVRKFIQISSDECYGEILKGAYSEDAPINPRNIYAATKAGADSLAQAYAHGFGLNTLITRTENNMGCWQHPQKVIPAWVKALNEGRKLPIYGDGQHVRQWLWVEDHVRALLLLLETETKPGEIFHVAGAQELTNMQLAERVITAYDGRSLDWKSRVQFIPDHDIRPGHDRRYALATDKIRALGWSPQVPLDHGIAMAVQWYKNHPNWLL